MCDSLKKLKGDNVEKIRIGTCIELFLLLDSFYSDFDRLDSFLNDNKSLLKNQDIFTITQQMQDIKAILINSVDVVLNDIDCNNEYLKYIKSAY